MVTQTEIKSSRLNIKLICYFT